MQDLLRSIDRVLNAMHLMGKENDCCTSEQWRKIESGLALFRVYVETLINLGSEIVCMEKLLAGDFLDDHKRDLIETALVNAKRHKEVMDLHVLRMTEIFRIEIIEDDLTNLGS